MNLSKKIIYGYAIALGFTFFGSLAGLLLGNSIHQQALEESQAVSQERRFLSTLQLDILNNRPAKQLSPYLNDPVAFQRESNKFLDRIDKILVLLERNRFLEKKSTIRELQTQLTAYEAFVRVFRGEVKQLMDEITPLTRSSDTLPQAELQLLRLVKNKSFVKFIEFPDRLLPFLQILDQREKEADMALTQAKLVRIEIYVASVLLSITITTIFCIKVSQFLDLEQAKSKQLLENQLIELKKSADALQTSESHQRAIISAIPDLLMRINREGIYLEFIANQTFSIVSNLEEIVGHHVDDTLPKPAAQQRMKYLHLALETNSMQMYEQELIVNGKIQIEEVRIVPYAEHEVLALVRDITEQQMALRDRQLAELSLQQSELTKRVIMESMPDLVIQMDLDGRYLSITGGASVRVKRPFKESTEFTINDFMSPYLAEQRFYHANKAVETGQMQIYEQQIDIDGDRRIEEVRLARLNDREVLTIIRDITEQKQFEQQLQSLNQSLEQKVQERTAKLRNREIELQKLSDRLGIALKSGAIGCWDWDIEQNTSLWDDRMYELYGVTIPVEPMVNCDILPRSLHPEDRDFVMNLLQETVLGLAEYDTEFRIVHPDASVHYIKAYGMVVRDAEGKPQSMIGVNFDISDRKKAELNLQLANEELLRATRLKDEFLANMSHELRTPLNAILGMTEGLQAQVYGNLNERQLKCLKTVENSGSHLLELINDILDLAKIESGQITLEYTPTSIDQLCQSSLAFVKQQALKKQIQLQVVIPPHLPTMHLDERRIRQVLINLLNNAVKFTPDGGHIYLEAMQLTQEPDQKYLRITVTDTGIGIAPENIQKLFKPFIQIDSALNRKYEGTGLGLSLVKQIVELHGGRVGLTSELGVGSCFTVEFPINNPDLSIQDRVEQDSVEHDSVEEDFVRELIRDKYRLKPLPKANTITNLSGDILVGEPNGLRSPLILLAEDNETNISSMYSYLEAKGYRIYVARDGLEAIAFAKEYQPDLILMDIQMPVMNGLDAIKQIRLEPNFDHTPIIALTALAMESDRQKCLDSGADDYITKPVKLQALSQTIQTFLT
jgi:signal transduction histidine kinase